MKIELEFAFVQDHSNDPNPEIVQTYKDMQTHYRQMITTLVEDMVRSIENCDIDYVKIRLNGKEFSTVCPLQEY